MKSALESEKKKTDTLLFEMLPVKVAMQLRDGKTVDAGKLANEQMASGILLNIDSFTSRFFEIWLKSFYRINSTGYNSWIQLISNLYNNKMLNLSSLLNKRHKFVSVAFVNLFELHN